MSLSPQVPLEAAAMIFMISECVDMSQTLNMTQGKPLKLLVRFALPLMFANVFQQLYTVVDTAIVGRGVGMNALAAIGCVDWLNWLVLGIAYGFTQGFSVRVAQKYGEGDERGMRVFMGQSALSCGILAVVCTVISQICLPLFLRFLRVPDNLSPMSELYTRILMGGLPVVFFFNYCSAMLRAVGDSKTPLIATAVASITNITLDIVAVFVLKWGIAGAAVATLIAQCLSGAICLVKIMHTPELRFGKEELVLQREIQKNLMGIGAPAAIKNVIIALGGIAVTAVVNTFGTSFIAGFTATGKLYGLLEIAALSYGYAITTYVGQNYGAMRFDRIKAGMKSATVLALITAVIIGAAMFLFGRSITMLFISSSDPVMAAEAGYVAYVYLCVMASFLPVLYMLYLFLSALQGLGDTVKPMISGGIELVFRVVVSLFIAWTGYEMGIFGAEISAWVGATVYLVYHYCKRIKCEI